MNIFRLVVVTLGAMIALLCVPAISTATNTSSVTAAVNHAVAAFNKGDMQAWVASCASPAAIIDEFPPHTWQGATACADWASAYAAFDKKSGVTGGMVTLGTPWHVTVTGTHAYVVYPATFTYKQNGKPMKESGSIFTLVLQKGSTGWLISAWCWAQH